MGWDEDGKADEIPNGISQNPYQVLDDDKIPNDYQSWSKDELTRFIDKSKLKNSCKEAIKQKIEMDYQQCHKRTIQLKDEYGMECLPYYGGLVIENINYLGDFEETVIFDFLNENEMKLLLEEIIKIKKIMIL